MQIWTVILVARRLRLWYTVLSAMKGDTTRKPTRFELRLQKAMNPRCRKYNRHLPPPAPEPPPQRSNLQAVIEEIRSGDLAAPRRDPCIPGGNRVNSISDGLESAAKAAVFVAGAVVADVVDSAKALLEARKAKRQEKIDSQIHEQSVAERRKYYGKDAERRRMESEKIRAATPPPANPMPTPEALIHAYVHRHVSEEAAIRFGSLVIDLEEHVRRTVAERDNDGRIVGVSGGVRKWLKENCPELLPHYHTCQRFKRKAQPDL